MDLLIVGLIGITLLATHRFILKPILNSRKNDGARREWEDREKEWELREKKREKEWQLREEKREKEWQLRLEKMEKELDRNGDLNTNRGGNAEFIELLRGVNGKIEAISSFFASQQKGNVPNQIQNGKVEGSTKGTNAKLEEFLNAFLGFKKQIDTLTDRVDIMDGQWVGQGQKNRKKEVANTDGVEDMFMTDLETQEMFKEVIENRSDKLSGERKKPDLKLLMSAINAGDRKKLRDVGDATPVLGKSNVLSKGGPRLGRRGGGFSLN